MMECPVSSNHMKNLKLIPIKKKKQSFNKYKFLKTSLIPTSFKLLTLMKIIKQSTLLCNILVISLSLLTPRKISPYRNKH